MSREARRVPMDFDWPLKKVWHGYINPHYRECPAAKDNLCNNGCTPSWQWLDAIARLLAMIGEHAVQEPHKEELHARGWTWPHPYLEEWSTAPRTRMPRDVVDRIRAAGSQAEKNREWHRYHVNNPPRLLGFGPEIGALVKGLAKVSARFVTLETGEVFVASTGYVRGARRTRGVGRSHERRIEAVN